MPKLGSAYIDVKANRKGLKPGLDAARKDVTHAATGMQSSIDKVNWAAVAASAVAMAAVVTVAINRSIDAASDLQEVTGKFDVVFADQSRQAEQWAQQLVDGYAMSTREAKQYMASIQDLLVPMGMQSDAAAKLSHESVKLAADLGSFNNLQTTQVIDDMQSALVGNYETMKKYGVVLNATVVQQKALEMGFASSKKELTAAHKAQAAYALIVAGSTAAIGDMARTADSYANQQKQLTANIEEFQAIIGGPLMDAITPIVKEMNNWAKANKELIAQEVQDGLQFLVEAMKLIAENLDLIVKGATLAAKGFEKMFHIDIIKNASTLLNLIKEHKAAILSANLSAIDYTAQSGRLLATGKIGPDTPGYSGYIGSDGNGVGSGHDKVVKALNAELAKSIPLVVEFKSEWNSIGKQTPLSEGEFSGIEWDDYFSNLETARTEDLEDYRKHNDALVQLSQRTADAMEDNFSDFFYQFKDGIGSIGDLWAALTDSMYRAWADMMGQMAKESLYGKDNTSGLLGALAKYLGSGSGSSGSAGQYESASDFSMDGGGYLGEGVRGVGLSTGQSYEFHPNEVVTPMGKMGANAMNVQVNIDNQSGVEIEQEEVSVIQPSPNSIVASLVLKRKLNSRSFRNSLNGG